MKLVLIRHGATDWNIERRMQGGTDISINAEGRDQAARLTPFLEAMKPGYVVTSALKRTIETAEAAGCTIDKSDPRLNEYSLGSWEGQLIDDLDPTQYDAWTLGDFNPEGGEGMSDFFLRINGAIFDVLSHASQNDIDCVAVFAHGGVIRHYLARGLGMDISKMSRHRHAAASVLDVTHDSMTLDMYNYVGL